MYKNVSRKAYTSVDLGATFRDSDLPRFGLTKPGFDSIAESAAEKFATQPGYIGKIVVSPRPKRKNLFTLPLLEDHLLVRQSYSILSRFLGLQTFSRDAEVRQLLSIVATEPKARILRTDVKSFFESVDLETVVADLRGAGFNNQSTIRHLESFVRHGKEHQSRGLPRGVSLSSLLADFSMREFDRKIKFLPTCCYYCRYVDDILVVTTDDNLPVFDEMQKFLPVGLTLNQKKTEDRRVGDSDRIEFLGYSILLSDSNRIRIAQSKLDKAKKRIALSLMSFISDRDFSLLSRRLQFLSTNTIMTMHARTKPIVVGFRYSYALASEAEVVTQLAQLDSQYYGMLNSSRFHVARSLSRLLTSTERKRIGRFSFLQGYKNKITLARSSTEIAEIKKAWRHA